jgi:hypothetical protein
VLQPEEFQFYEIHIGTLDAMGEIGRAVEATRAYLDIYPGTHSSLEAYIAEHSSF